MSNTPMAPGGAGLVPRPRRSVIGLRIHLLIELLVQHADDELLAAMAEFPVLHAWVLQIAEHRTRPPTHDIVRPLLASRSTRIRRRAFSLCARLPK